MNYIVLAITYFCSFYIYIEEGRNNLETVASILSRGVQLCPRATKYEVKKVAKTEVNLN